MGDRLTYQYWPLVEPDAIRLTILQLEKRYRRESAMLVDPYNIA
jgi:hypothetical protein